MGSVSKLLLLILLFSTSAFAMGPTAALPRFQEVVKGEIYRGGHPNTAGLEQLAQMKIKTDLDLENNLDTDVGAEGAEVRKLGMSFISVPLSALAAPSDQDIQRIERILQDPTAQPVYVHCQHGEDRTGLVIGLYRVFVQHWSPQEAYDEMEKDGFHKALLGLYLYFKEATGYDD